MINDYHGVKFGNFASRPEAIDNKRKTVNARLAAAKAAQSA